MVKSWTIIGVLFLTMTGILHGQGQRIGTIDSDRILDRMPEYSGIEQRLQLLSESWEEELRGLDREIETLQEEFEAREVLYTDEMREVRRSRIEAVKRQREYFLSEKFGPDGEYFRRQQELLEPLQRQVFNAVNQIARREGFDFIIDRAQDVRFLYADPEWDLTDQVLEELGLSEGEAAR